MGSYLSGLSRPDNFSANAFEQYTIGSESSNKAAESRARKLRDQTQLMVKNTLDGDSACNICVFGLMGHGKSRFINLLYTAVQNDPESLSSVVPSGAGSTTRAYSRYEVPVSKGGRYPFFMVDTIGVKFADESRPSQAELDSEFSYVRKQLRSLDFRHRIGAFKDSYSDGQVVVAAGEDILDLSNMHSFQGESGLEYKVTVQLRGGALIHNVPLNVIHDPEGCNWTFSPVSGYKDIRSFSERMKHKLAAWHMVQTSCKSVILVVNPLQDVAPVIFEKWKVEFANAGFHNPILVSTHADVLQLLGASSKTLNQELEQASSLRSTTTNAADALVDTNFIANSEREAVFDKERQILDAAKAVEAVAIQRLRDIRLHTLAYESACSDSVHPEHPPVPHRVENYAEMDSIIRRRWVSESNAMTAFLKAAVEARYRVRTMIRGEGWQYRLGSSLHNITEMENAGFYLTQFFQKVAAGMATTVAITVAGLVIRKRIILKKNPIK